VRKLNVARVYLQAKRADRLLTGIAIVAALAGTVAAAVTDDYAQGIFAIKIPFRNQPILKHKNYPDFEIGFSTTSDNRALIQARLQYDYRRVRLNIVPGDLASSSGSWGINVGLLPWDDELAKISPITLSLVLRHTIKADTGTLLGNMLNFKAGLAVKVKVGKIHSWITVVSLAQYSNGTFSGAILKPWLDNSIDEYEDKSPEFVEE